MAGRREEAAPTFGTWTQRLADTPESERAGLVEQCRGMLTVLGERAGMGATPPLAVLSQMRPTCPGTTVESEYAIPC